MATFAIGDIHGCYRTLMALLRQINDDPTSDRLWCVGDLVNRGPDSLAVLRWAKAQGDRLVCVLGNHDLHLLAYAAGVRPHGPNDTLTSVLAASDAPDLLDWLCRRPLIYRENARVLLHAGLLPQWTIDQAVQYARRVESQLTEPRARHDLLARWRASTADNWDTASSDAEQDILTLSALTRMRICTPTGKIARDFSGPRDEIPADYFPWFETPTRRSMGAEIYCGHWAMLGLHQSNQVSSLDSGCHWGHSLTAIRLDDGKLYDQPNCE